MFLRGSSSEFAQSNASARFHRYPNGLFIVARSKFWRPEAEYRGTRIGGYYSGRDSRCWRNPSCELTWGPALEMLSSPRLTGLNEMSAIRSWFLLPFHLAALATRAKSFRDKPIIGSATLNRLGLHVARIQVAAAMVAWRRRRLLHLIRSEDAAAFARDGFVIRYNFLPENTFRALQREIRSKPAPARDMRQGNAITRRIALDPPALKRYPTYAALLNNPEWLGLLRYIGASALTPQTYLQSIFSHACDAPDDPQTLFHADTFHSSVKAWLFLTDVGADEGPFV